jgi:hypothetical protein
MTCGICEGQGWFETFHAGAASFTPALKQCPHGCSISGYSKEVQRRLNDPNHVTETPVLRGIPSEKPLAPVVQLFRRNDGPTAG